METNSPILPTQSIKVHRKKVDTNQSTVTTRTHTLASKRSEQHRKLTVLTARTLSSQKALLSILLRSAIPAHALLPARCAGACEGVCACPSVCCEVTGFNFPSQRQFVFIAHGRSWWSSHLCHDSADGLQFTTCPSTGLIF